MPSLVQDRIDGRVGVRGEVGDHDILGIIVKEEPGLLPAKGFGEWVGIFHGRSTDFAIRYATDKRFEACPLSLRAVERHSTIVHGSAGNEIPIPRSSDVFVFVTL
jgi:hypothetical protein